jgi:hypothetical protein
VFAVALGHAANAHAGKSSGSLGLGVDTSLSAASGQAGAAGSTGTLVGAVPLSSPGMSAVYQATDRVAAQVILSWLRATTTDGGGVRSTTSALGFAMRGFYALELARAVDVSGFAGLGIGRTSAGVEAGTDVVFEAGARPEWFVTSHLSLHTQIGLTIALLSATSPANAGAGGSATNLLGNADLVGNIGFTFWF